MHEPDRDGNGAPPALDGRAGASRPALDVGAVSHPGRVRTQNEDRFFASPERGIFAVADGMGGHEAGEVASTAIVDALALVGPAPSASGLLDGVEAEIVGVNATLQRIAAERGKMLGSTVVVLLVYEGDYACLWCGDSRIYRVRAGELAQLSRDHTEVQDLMERGILTAEEAKTWPRRHVITRAVGAKADLELALDHGRLEPGDTFILCSDGLTGHVEPAEILGFARRGRSAQDVCDGLLDLTLERGAGDNVTVVAIRVGDAPPAAGRGDATVVSPRPGLPGGPAR